MLPEDKLFGEDAVLVYDGGVALPDFTYSYVKARLNSKGNPIDLTGSYARITWGLLRTGRTGQ